MDAQSAKTLYTRVSTNDHARDLVPWHATLHDDFKTVIQNVFRHQPAVYGTVQPGPKLMQRHLAAEFYRSYFIRDIAIKQRGQMRMSPEQFISAVVTRDCDGDRNNFAFLLGDVGCGKTAYINWLITRWGRQWHEQNGLWFLRVDVNLSALQDTDTQQPLNAHSLADAMIKKILRIAQPHDATHPPLPFLYEGDMREPFRALHAADNERPDDRVTVLASFIHAVRRTRRLRLFLVLDNMDFIFHSNDRDEFMDDHDTQEMPAVRGVTALAHDFRHGNNPLGHLGANILFVLRFDSHSHLVASLPELQEPGFNNTYELDCPTPNEVLEKRRCLLEWAVEQEPLRGRRTAFETFLQDMYHAIYPKTRPGIPESEQGTLISHIRNMTNTQLRQLLEYFSDYGFIHDADGAGPRVLRRFIEQYPVGVIAFMLGKKLRFSQNVACFPNIYYVNSRDAGLPRHPHSYWLKRLILEYIAHESVHPDRALLPRQVVEVFCGAYGYEEPLVRKCLGSLGQAAASNVLRARKVLDQARRCLRISHIQITQRGEYCRSEVFDRFGYLQLVVDEPDLPLPKCVEDRFVWKESTNYAYLVAEPVAYASHARAVVDQKAEQVLILKHILAESLEIERNRYRTAFHNLEEAKVPIPSTNALQNRLHSELDRLHRGGQMSRPPLEIWKEVLAKYGEGIREDLHQGMGAS